MMWPLYQTILGKLHQYESFKKESYLHLTDPTNDHFLLLFFFLIAICPLKCEFYQLDVLYSNNGIANLCAEYQDVNLEIDIHDEVQHETLNELRHEQEGDVSYVVGSSATLLTDDEFKDDTETYSSTQVVLV